jgi:CRISPR-associated Cas5-like protein
MKFIRMQCLGCLNSFRQPDFHTYHKTLSLPPKTTVAGMIGSALGLSPEEINERWLLAERFKMGIVGKNNGKANDLWQIRKYEDKQIKEYAKGSASTPYKTAVIVRELLYSSDFLIYFSFENEEDLQLTFEGLKNPQWALSLGREDEIIKIKSLDIIQLGESDGLSYQNTIIPGDLTLMKYQVNLKGNSLSSNLLNEAPKVVKLPVTFTYNESNSAREASKFETFSFIFNLPITLESGKGYLDEELNVAFKIF